VDITVEEDRAAIWLVGEGIAGFAKIGNGGNAASTLARACTVLQLTGVRLTSQGSSSLSLGFAIREVDLQPAMEALHREFFAAPDRDVFAVGEYAPASASQAASQPSQRRPSGQPQALPAH
jgi:aspartate kinase